MAFYDKPTHGDEDNAHIHGQQEPVVADDSVVPACEPAIGAEQECRKELAACIQDVNDLKETCKRVAADFENFKKRVERDRIAWTKSAQAEVLRDLLPIVDDFDRAIAEYQKSQGQSQHESWIAGFELIRKTFDKFLHTYGVTEIKQMTSFDPELHEAITQVESTTHKTGEILDVVQKGYMFNGHLLRAARVTVAK